MNFQGFDEYTYNSFENDLNTFSSQNESFLEYGTQHALTKQNSKGGCKESIEEDEESLYVDGNNESKVDDIDENNTKSTCIDFECRDIVDDEYNFPDVDGIDFTNHLNLLLELDDNNGNNSGIHHPGSECNCMNVESDGLKTPNNENIGKTVI